jgi:hypothetical protein
MLGGKLEIKIRIANSLTRVSLIKLYSGWRQGIWGKTAKVSPTEI